MTARQVEIMAGGLRWTGRVLALILFLLWGAFFVEHLAEWFVLPKEGPPPPRVWLAQGLHLAMLVGLFLMLRWEALGGAVTVLATTAFFASIGVKSFPFIALLNLAPIACFALGWLIARSGLASSGNMN